MCQTIQCSECSKLTYIGCGKHLKTLFINIPIHSLCICDKEKFTQITKAIK